jgi:aminopeptidase YwaD
VPGTNVVGYLPGSDPEFYDEYIVIGAHYDHLGYEYRNGERVIYNGADDNASGVAVVIELARYFVQNPDLLGRSVIFVAFDAEESGLLGSEIFIGENEVLDKDKVKVMFSLDMVGMYEAHRGLSLPGVGTLKGGEELALKVASAQDLRLKNTTAEIPSRTDTWPFGEIGIPAIQAFTGLESPYHRPEDTYDLLDYAGMARITVYLQALVSAMSVMPELDSSRRFARLQRPYGLRFNTGILANIGSTHHSYRDEFFRANNVFAFSTGLFLQVQAGQKFSLQPEILYDYNGSRSPEGTYRRHSVITPLNLHFYLAGDQRGMIKAYTIAGGYHRFNFAGKNGGENMDFNNSHPASEWGVNLGFGLKVMKLDIAFTFRRALTDISILPENTIFNTGQFFTIGYRLGN